ncbi:MAG TPA: MFS transporter [Bryobacteraceae bacterium]
MSSQGSPRPSPVEGQQNYKWYRDLNGYQWLVVVVATVGWMCDTMAQQLFNLARVPALRDLLGPAASAGEVSEQAGYATMVFMIGWAIGGVLFGILGDRIGRAKTMILTILVYSIFTGLSVLSTGVWDFNMYRFLCGLGVGGEFGVGVALVSEVVPARARPYALGTVQAFSALGNMLAALTGIVAGQLEQSGAIAGAWRYEFLVGALPAPLALLIFMKLKEPESWLRNRAAKTKMGSYSELFSDPRWRRNAMVGFLLAFAGVVGLWGIGFFSYDLFRPVLERTFRAQGLTGAALAGKTTTWIGLTSMFQNLGAFFGVYGFTYLTQRVGRKKAFAVSFVGAMAATAFTFLYLTERSQIFWMVPLMGFTQLALFGGYAIYFPELFPTRLRSTGTSFCYNVGRLIAAGGPLTLGMLTRRVFTGPDAMRYAGVTMCAVFVLGLIALPFAPETKDKPLPE